MTTNALTLYGSADLGALLDGGRKRRAKRRSRKSHGADALFAAMLDAAKRGRKPAKRSAKRRRTPPRDPRTGLFLPRGAKAKAPRKSARGRRHHADLALDLALALDAARHGGRRRARKTRTHTATSAAHKGFHALFGAATKKASPTRKKASKPRDRYVDPTGLSAEDLRVFTALGLVKPTPAQRERSEKEVFAEACLKSPKVLKTCEEAWAQHQLKTNLSKLRQFAQQIKSY